MPQHADPMPTTGNGVSIQDLGCCLAQQVAKKCITTTVQEFYLVFGSKITVIWAGETITDV